MNIFAVPLGYMGGVRKTAAIRQSKHKLYTNNNYYFNIVQGIQISRE